MVPLKTLPKTGVDADFVLNPTISYAVPTAQVHPSSARDASLFDSVQSGAEVASHNPISSASNLNEGSAKFTKS